MLPRSLVPQFPVQLALDEAVVVEPTFTLPPVPARTVSVHCGVGGGSTMVEACTNRAVRVTSSVGMIFAVFVVGQFGAAAPLTPAVSFHEWKQWPEFAVAVYVTSPTPHSTRPLAGVVDALPPPSPVSPLTAAVTVQYCEKPAVSV